jgi:hypothetical protein
VGTTDILECARSWPLSIPPQRLAELIDCKLAMARQYDVLGIDRAVAICFWLRSGSVLLASYLDGHDDILMLPKLCSRWIYPFLDEYGDLPLREKLLLYPFYLQTRPKVGGEFHEFFTGAFAIDPEEYVASVSALVEVNKQTSEYPPCARRAFIQFLHVAYDLCIERPSRSPHPLIVYGQHDWRDDAARRFIEDFPDGRFIHTVREPIAAVDSFFSWEIEQIIRDGVRPQDRGVSPEILLTWVLFWDRPHSAMVFRTRAVRFEDLHLNTAGILARLCEWLEIPFRPALLQSTFNGKPYVVERAGKTWSGPRVQQVVRRAQNMWVGDRLLFYALLYENFERWGYRCPRAFGKRLVRSTACYWSYLLPMKFTFACMALTIRLETLPYLKAGRIWPALHAALWVVSCHVAFLRRFRCELRRRLSGDSDILQLL